MAEAFPRYTVQDFAGWIAQTGVQLPASAEPFMFGDGPELARELAELVARGEKTATAGLLWAWELDGGVPPVGRVYVVHDWDGIPLAIIESTSVRVIPFTEVDLQFALDEGEGFRSIEDWRDAHWEYFARECERLDRALSPSVPVVCLRFRRVYPV